MNRRDFLHAGCTVAAASLIPSAIDRAEASFHHGSVVGGGSNPNPLASQRNILNILQSDVYYYAMINHFQFADAGLLPNGTSPALPFGSIIDAQGWPNTPDIWGHGFNGGGIRVPSTDNYTGNYTLDWIGTCEFTFASGFWTLVSSVNAGQVGGVGAARFKSTTGIGATSGSVTVTLTGLANPGGFPNLLNMQFADSDLDHNGNYVRGFRFYRTGDKSRLDAGKIFRLPFLQPIVDMNPSAMRFMDWCGNVDDQNCRWENRLKPDHGTYKGGDYTASPSYGFADYVAGAGTTHQYTLAAATPTASNPKTTPVALTHGEVVTTIMQSGLVRGGGARILGITQAATPTVTAEGPSTGDPHPFIVGDVITHSIPFVCGMQQLDRRKCQVLSVPTPTSYTINIDTSGFAAYSTFTDAGGLHQATSTFYVSLNVAGRGDFAVVFPDGGTSPTAADGLDPGQRYIKPGGTFTFWFDKTLAPINNSSGVPIKGAWITRNADGNPGGGGVQGQHGESMPIELCTALVLEANELSVSQGIANPIHLWLCCPFRGLISADAVWAGDYSSGSNFATNMVDVALNGSTINGVTYRGLKAINGPSLLLENANETWNGFSFQSSAGNGILGKDQYGGINGYPMARSVGMSRDVKAAFPSETRVKFVIGAWQDNTAPTNARINNTGDPNYTSFRQAGWGATPISEHDAVAVAPYLTPWGNFQTPYNSGWRDDNAKFLGTDNTGALIITGSTQTFTCNASTTNVVVTSAVSGGTPTVGQKINGVGTFGDKTILIVSGSNPTYTLTLDNPVSIAAGAVLSTYNLLTTAVTAGPVVAGQTLYGAGVGVDTFVVAVSGVSPNYTLTLNNIANVSAGGKVSSLSVMTANASTSSASLVITAANVPWDATVLMNSNGVVARVIAGSGISFPTYVVGISGTYPNYTLTLDHPISFVGGTVSLVNVPGGNYIGAADQATAIQNFVNVVKAGSGGSFTETINRYCDPSNPTAGVDAGYASLAGKPIIQYEGGTNWLPLPTILGGVFTIAVNQSSQWAQAEKDFWDARATVPNLAMPALYAWIRGSQDGQNFQWAYASPDNYNASHVEGGALNGTGFWPAICARNRALTI